MLDNISSIIYLASNNFDKILPKTFEAITTRYLEYGVFIPLLFLAILAFKERKILASTLLIFTACAWVFIQPAIFDYLESIGTDSISELLNANFSEVLFWLDQIEGVFSGFASDRDKVYSAFRIALYTSSALILKLVIDQFSKAISSIKLKKQLGLLLIFTSVSASVALTIGSAIAFLFLHQDSVKALKSEFKTPTNPPKILGIPPRLLIYIGESTSSMHMGIYGYPRDTTPFLSKILKEDPNIIKFNNIYSDHTHTVESLTSAFSFTKSAKNPPHTEVKSKRYKVAQILTSAGLSGKLTSNQPKQGFWSDASKILFETMIETKRLNITKGKYDYDVFAPEVTKFISLESNVSFQIIHSYAGHGPYLENIPIDFRENVDSKLRNAPNRWVVGSAQTNPRVIEEYDSAIRYVDYSVSQTIQQVKDSSQPIVFLYFSDHGEAPFLSRGHDSAQFSIEMASVPFIVYFNKVARENYPNLFERLKNLADKNSRSYLSSLPSLIFSLMGMQNNLDTNNIIGVSSPNKYILKRNTVSGRSSISLEPEELLRQLKVADNGYRTHRSPHSMIPLTDLLQQKGAQNCYHRSNTFAKAVRGLAFLKCVEIDIHLTSDGDLKIGHDEHDLSPIPLEFLINEKRSESRSFWFDLKNAHTSQSCVFLNMYFSKIDIDFTDDLLEFPATFEFNDNASVDCLKTLRTLGFRIAFHLPSSSTARCADHLIQDFTRSTSKDCTHLDNLMLKVKSAGVYTDITFDYGWVAAVVDTNWAQSFSWNSWHIKPSDAINPNLPKFHKVLLFNHDLNNL